jgi:CRP-like cAMP-binding protein
MAIALQRTARRHGIPSPVQQVELVPAPGNVDAKLAGAHEALGDVPIFKDVLDAQQLDALVAACNVRSLPSKTVFIGQGEPGTSMFVILEGVARVSVSVASGEARDLAVLTAGDIVGEMSLMTGAPRTATVTSLTFVRVLEVTKQSIEALLKATPGLLERFSRVLADRQSELREIAGPTHHEPSEPDILDRMREFFSRTFR